jgi:hypothetical protein
VERDGHVAEVDSLRFPWLSYRMASLRSALNDLASSFAESVVDAIRGASLQELLGETGGAPRRGPGRPKGVAVAPETNGKPARAARSGRLPRRSLEDITKALEQVVALVKKSKTGLRAEQIRQQLDMQAKEMPRVLKEGLAKKALKSKGQKRATTYTA